LRRNSMFNVLSQINWLAVLLATVAMSMLGAAWFMGLVGKRYAAALGRTDLGDAKPSALLIVGPMLCCAAVVVTDAILLKVLDVSSLSDALAFGAITGIGFLGAQTVNIAINPNFPRPFYYSAINVPYFVIGNIMTCAILIAMS
jgi:Protein of unknown function (DUF1761)